MRLNHYNFTKVSLQSKLRNWSFAAAIGLTIFSLCMISGCATPPEVKQAVASMESEYQNNRRLMHQYHQLLENLQVRARYWNGYISRRGLLETALKYATRGPASDTEERQAELNTLGPKLTDKVNSVRLINIPNFRPDGDNRDAHDANPGSMESLVTALPEIVHLVGLKVQEKPSASVEMGPFQAYDSNVAALSEINKIIKGYLDIDVTIKGDDVKELADAIRQLR